MLNGEQKSSICMDDCLKDAKKYKLAIDWQRSSPHLYNEAVKFGILEICLKAIEKNNLKKNIKKSVALLPKKKDRFEIIKTENPKADIKITWTLEICKKISSQYKSVKEWHDKESFSYQASLENNWLEVCFLDMIKRNQKGLNILEEYHDIKDNIVNINKDRNLTINNQDVQENNVKLIRQKRSKFTKEECIIEARKHSTRSRWARSSPSTYYAARNHGWSIECTAHMQKIHWKKLKKIKSHEMTIEYCISEAQKYLTIHNWETQSPESFIAAFKLGAFEKCIAHMNNFKKRA